MSKISDVNEDMEQNKSKWSMEQTSQVTVKKIVKTAFLVLAWICLVSTINIVFVQGQGYLQSPIISTIYPVPDMLRVMYIRCIGFKSTSSNIFIFEAILY